MTFEVTILGSSSATPVYQRHPTAQLLNLHERFFLIDCGEGTQMQLSRYKIRSSRISHVFISHMHGDHYLGLMGLLSTWHLNGRKDILHLYGPSELKDIIDLQLKVSQTQLGFPVEFKALRSNDPEVIMEDGEVTVSTIPMYHRIPCTGFLFREKPAPRKLITEKIDQYKIPVHKLNDIKQGHDFDAGNAVIPNRELTLPPREPRSYAYCSDTAYDERICRHVQGVNLLYHEATFMDDLADRAVLTFHSTCRQAAAIARKAEVMKLLIGHFSARYKILDPFLDEAKEIFSETFLALEGEKFRVEWEGNGEW